MILKFQAETPIINGFNRSCIYDLPRNHYDFLPLAIVNKLYSFENRNRNTIIDQLDANEKLWLNYLIEKEYCFFIPQEFKDAFPKINFKWTTPSLISNTIIDLGKATSRFDFKILEELNCKHLLIRIENYDDLNALYSLLKKKIGTTTFKSIDLHIRKKSGTNYLSFKKRIKKEITQIMDISFYNKKRDDIPSFFSPFFLININTFSESLRFNSYYNRKLYIDKDGNIKNGIEKECIFSNINQNIDLKKIVLSPNYRNIWSINKDKIDICKDCEFRYMCIDNRIPIKRDNETYYFEEECPYNPYISKWKGDNDYKSLDEIGIISNKTVFSIDLKKVKKINSDIWTNN